VTERSRPADDHAALVLHAPPFNVLAVACIEAHAMPKQHGLHGLPPGASFPLHERDDLGLRASAVAGSAHGACGSIVLFAAFMRSLLRSAAHRHAVHPEG